MRLVEREAELAALKQHWVAARAGSGGLVLVAAESGGGKTALVNEFGRTLPGQAPILWGACDPLATPRPLGPLLDMEDHFARRTRTLLKGSGQAHEIFLAVLEDLRARPCVLVVDDLHWADQGTVDLLRFLLRRISTTSSLVVGTVRPDEVGPAHALRALLGDAARSGDAVSLFLKPLSSDAIRTLVDDRPLDAEHLLLLTGGNPFFVTQMLEHGGSELPPTVRDAILARTVSLDDPARDLLDLLVCAPESIPDRLLPQLGIGLSPLRALHQVGLIRRSQRGVAFRHDLCRLAIAGSLPPGGEVALHRRMLDALEADASADPAVMVHHARGAEDPERVLRYASAAGIAAARTGAHTQAADFLQLALDTGKAITPQTRADLLERLATEQYVLDRLDQAITSGTQALRLRQRVGDVAAVSADHQALATYEWYRANREAADRHAADAVAVLHEADEPVMLGHALALQAYLAMQRNDLTTARSLLGRATEPTGRSDDWVLRERTKLLDGIFSVVEGRDEGRGLILEVVEPAVNHFDEVHSSGFSNLAYLDVEQRRLVEATAVLDVSLPLTVEFDLPVCHVWQLGARGRLALLQGDWGRAEADASAVLARPSAPLARTWAFLIRGLLGLRRSGSAGTDLDEAWDLANRLGEPLRLMPAAGALAEQVWLSGASDPRVEDAVGLLRRFDGVGLEWAIGDLAVCLQRLDPKLVTEDLNVAEPHRLQLAGHHGAAAAAWDRLGTQYERSLALIDSGEPKALRHGFDQLERLGADAVAAKLRQDLRDRGVANVPTRRRATTRTNAAGLTAREVEVLRLLDEGLSNAEVASRLYISPKTTDHHVSSILTKLQVSSRQRAALAGRELGILHCES